MRRALKPATAYGILLILLFAIAAVAVRETLKYIGHQIQGSPYLIIVILISCITYGFMLIAGAFGLWAIQFATQAEVQRRLGRLVDAMDYFQDGVVAIDRRGTVRGSNPAAKTLCGLEIPTGTPLQEALPALTGADIAQIVGSRIPSEIQKELADSSGVRTLRFRSQFTDDLALLLISDITSNEARRHKRRQEARISLIGQLARGLAHDINNLLCTISGHTALLDRLPVGTPDRRASMQAISRCIDRGTGLAEHLLALTTQSSSSPTRSPVSVEYVRTAVASLKDSLPPGWTITADLAPLPPLALTGIKIEQVVLNLGLLAAERASDAGALTVTSGVPSAKHPLLNVDPRYVAVIVVAIPDPPSAAEHPQPLRDASGVILSVIRTMIEAEEGRLDILEASTGWHGFRVCLPYRPPLGTSASGEEYIEELRPYIAGWHVLAAAMSGKDSTLHDHLRALDLKITAVPDVTALIGCVEDGSRTDAILLDQRMAAREWPGLLRALRKLAPGAALLVITDTASQGATNPASDYVTLPPQCSRQELLLALIEAKSLAAKAG